MKKQNLFVAFVIVLSTIACKTENNQYSELGEGIFAEFKTNHGTFIAQLDYQKAPLTVASFVSLAEGTSTEVADEYKGKNYFDGLLFHRIVSGFVIQGGDPEGTGMGGPGYQFPNEISEDLKHDSKGVLSMANAGPDTNGSQFFVTLAPTPNLDGGYSVFGRVVEGQEVVDAIGQVAVGGQDKPVEDVVMESVRIIRNGDDAKNFDAPGVFDNQMSEIRKKEIAALEALEIELDELSEGYEKTASGLRYKITEEVPGGKKPVSGQEIHVFYKGMLSDGNVFDQRLEENGQDPLSFNVGTGRVIPGWDEGLMLLREGESARLIIPPHIGYGERGAGPIPPNSILIFDVTLKELGQ